MNELMLGHQPIHSHFLLALANASGGEPLNLCPSPYSNIIRGIPAVRIAKKYGIKKAPPPLEYNTYGYLQIFPRPTADPTAAKINPALELH